MYRCVFTLIFLVYTGSLFAQITEQEKECIRQQNMAQKDNYNNELKYYTFYSQAMNNNPRFELLPKYILLKEKYNVGMQYLYIADYDFKIHTCYNEEADRILKRKYGNDFWERVEQQVDSMNTLPFKPPH